jgi:hypothetical protein
VLAKLALYLLSHNPALVALVILEIGFCFKPGSAWTAVLQLTLLLAGMSGMHHMPSFLLVEMVCLRHFAQVGLELCPPNLCLPSRHRLEPPCLTGGTIFLECIRKQVGKRCFVCFGSTLV